MFHCCWYPVHEIGGFFFCVITFYVIIVHWLLRIDEVYDTFHLRCLSLPLVSNQNMSITPFLFLFSSDMFAMLTLVVTKFIQDKVNIFQCICCGSFQIYMLIVTYHFARIDHDTDLSFLFWNLFSLFLRDSSQHLCFLPISDCCKIGSCQAITFHWIFSNYPFTHMNKVFFGGIRKKLLMSPSQNMYVFSIFFG